jgi:ubiquinone/menaquinone biosynthesis C-methylase UbiE
VAGSSPAPTGKVRVSEEKAIQEEFERAASAFSQRTRGRFDDLPATEFSRVRDHETVLEVGCGTGNFLRQFRGRAQRLVGLDLTAGMLGVARAEHPDLELVQGNARRLPFASASVDLVTSAQALHHIWDPIPVAMEMRRVAGPEGRVMIVDQHTTESYEEASFMNQLEVIRDPSHAVSRPPSAFRIIIASSGLEIVDEHLWEGTNRLSQWMWPDEFPVERIEQVRLFIEKHGPETGMNWERDGDDWVFTRRRMMILARRA